MANNNPNQNQGKQEQAKHGNQASQQQGQKSQQAAGREVNPSRPAGEPGKLPQNAGSALDSGKGGTATQQQQNKSQSAQAGQSKSMNDAIGQKHSAGTPTKGTDSRASRPDQDDQDAPTGIGQAVRKGETESIKHGEDDLGHRSEKDKGDCCGGNNKPM